LRGYQGLEFQLSELTDRKLIKFSFRSLLLQRENVVLTATRLCHPLSFK
jgi:hypothetical protein